MFVFQRAVTDSAAAATAMSCGIKTYNGAIGVDPEGKPCGSIFEGNTSTESKKFTVLKMKSYCKSKKKEET